MRHVPTSLYIDTEFIKGQSLRFDTKAFTVFVNTFAKGGLRLLIPAIMERELYRHFMREAEKVSEAVTKAHKAYPVINLSLAELPSKEQLKTKCIEEMDQRWSFFKNHFVVETLPIAGNLEEVVDWYFEIRPPFSKNKPKEFPDAFILSTLDQYHEQHQANIAVISKDGDFINACGIRRYIWYFPDLEKYIEAFQPELSGKERIPEEVDLTKPITTEDLTELRSILARGDQVTSIEIQRVMQLLERRGSNYDYFFQNAKDVIWLQPLSEKGFFLNPPNLELTSDGHCVAPFWAPIEFLIRIFAVAPVHVLEEISKIPETDNFRVLEGIVKIVLKADSIDVVLRFSHFISSFIENCRWGHELIINLIKKPYFFDSRLSEIAPAILLKLVEFRRNPREQEKLSNRNGNIDVLNSSIEPAPNFEQWIYQQILENGIRPLAEKEPYQVARILIDATAGMIRMRMHPEALEKNQNEDNSEIWCRRMDKPDRRYQDVKEILVHTLTHACEKVFEKAPESIEALDHALRNQRWKLFKRLRQQLYASYPNDQTLPWIREMILDHKDYSRWEYHYEFQLMIRKSSEFFGHGLLSEAERMAIFQKILNGPPKEDYLQWLGGEYSEDAYNKRQRYFHLMQLRPFATLLSGEYRRYFDDLVKEKQVETVSDDSYLPYTSIKSGWVTHQSPKSMEDLEKLSDDKILEFLNDWDESYRDRENWLVEYDVSALSGVFQTLFKERIVPDKERLGYWMMNREKIARPVYVVAMVKAMMEIVKDRCFDNLDQWMDFCAWILSHSDTEQVEGQPQPNEESCDHPDWGRPRRAVVDFIEVCLNKETSVPVAVRDDLANLLQQVCVQFDWWLDCDRPVVLNHDDQITEAINKTRSRALEALVNFGFWVRRYLPEDPVSEVTEILSKRLATEVELRLTRPERALLGMHFGSLCSLNQVWAVQQKNVLFPQADKVFWHDAFVSYIRFNRPVKKVFEILREDFEYALDNLDEWLPSKDGDRNYVNRLGQHIFTYYPVPKVLPYILAI